MRIRNLLFVFATLIASSIASAQPGNIIVTQNISANCWQVQNNNDVYMTVRFMQPSYDVTLKLAPHETRLVGQPDSYRTYFCTVGTPEVKGTFMTEPDYATPDDQIECK
jgi:hypothetical protein